MRDNCEYKERCGKTGHYVDKGQWTRCACLTKEINKRKLGPMFDPNPIKDTQLISLLEKDLCLEGTLTELRPHVSGALLELERKGKYWLTMDAYRLIEIFLDQDKEMETTAAALSPDMLIILIGFGDPRNKYLPELMIQTLSRRELETKPTWVVLGTDLNLIGTRYSQALQDRLSMFQKVKVK